MLPTGLLPFAPFTALLILAAGRPPVERTVYVMGTVLTATVEATESPTAVLEAAVREVERTEAVISTWDPETEISRLNDATVGTVTHPSAEVAALLSEVARWSQETGGAFHPAVGALVDTWDLRGVGRRPSPGEMASAMAATGPRGLHLDPASGAVTRLHPSAWLDSGGFGKGAALRNARGLLVDGVQRALLDLGGQVMAVSGPGEATWDVGVAHPDHRDEALVWLRLANASAATSGNSQRAITVGGERIGHLLDPRTGQPVRDWGSVTVVAEDALVADILSTALYVMGPEAGMAWASERPDIGALFLVRSGQQIQTLHNQAMRRWLAPQGPEAGPSQTSTPHRRNP